MPDSNVRDLSPPARRDRLRLIQDALDDTPARAATRSMLNASVAAEAAEELIGYLASVKRRALMAGKIDTYQGVHAVLFADGTGVVQTSQKTFGSIGEPVSVAIAEAEAWLQRDELAELNATFGLTADGLIAERMEG